MVVGVTGDLNVAGTRSPVQSIGVVPPLPTPPVVDSVAGVGRADTASCSTLYPTLCTVDVRFDCPAAAHAAHCEVVVFVLVLEDLMAATYSTCLTGL